MCSADLLTQFSFSSPDDSQQAKIERELSVLFTSLSCLFPYTFISCWPPSLSLHYPQIHLWWPARTQGWWWWMRCWTCTPTNSHSQRQASAFSSPRISPPSLACAWQGAWSSTRYTARVHTLRITFPWFHPLGWWVFKCSRATFSKATVGSSWSLFVFYLNHNKEW